MKYHSMNLAADVQWSCDSCPTTRDLTPFGDDGYRVVQCGELEVTFF